MKSVGVEEPTETAHETEAAMLRRDAVAPRIRSRALGPVRARLRDVIAGSVASIVLMANIISFGALMFPGELAAGIPVAIWAMLIGSCVGGIWIALATSLPPLSTGIDSPTGAVLVSLSATTGASVLAAGGTLEAAIQTVMLVFTAATFVTGATLYVIGAFRWGSYCRFVPYFVVGGFLAATGWFLIAGGVRMTTGVSLSLTPGGPAWTTMSTAKLASAIVAFLCLLAVRRWSKWALAMPAALVVMWLLGVGALYIAGLSGREHGWYLPSLSTLTEWQPLDAARVTHLTWRMVIDLMPQFVAVAVVTLISLVTKVASIEVVRETSGNLDREFRAHGIANLITPPIGGIACALQTGPSHLLVHAGGATRMSGAVAAMILGAIGVAHFDLPGLIPVPIIAGLVFYLGYTFFLDALSRPYAQRSWQDLLLAILIMLVCIQYGYVVGVIAGVIGACVLFAMNYARLGVIRRHATRKQLSSDIYRSTEATAYLRDAGDAIQIYWLSGYIFFGSSEGLLDRIRGDIESRSSAGVAYVVLDCGMVSGADASAVVSLTKLRNYCDQIGTTLVYCSLSPHDRPILEHGGFFGRGSRHHAFSDLNHGLGWCEDQMIAAADLDQTTDLAGFESWLQHQLGPTVNAAEMIAYLQRRDITEPQIIYHEGEPADSIDLVAAGNLAVDVTKSNGERMRVRRIRTHTVVGEMGFVRHSFRSATVSSDGPATIFTLTRGEFERMRRERPDLASAFDDFIMRTLADRMDGANRAAAALAG